MFTIKRSRHNPVLIPNREHYWESFATFNPSPVKRGRTSCVLYRAISAPDILTNPSQRSVIGLAQSSDGKHYAKHMPDIVPKEEW